MDTIRLVIFQNLPFIYFYNLFMAEGNAGQENNLSNLLSNRKHQ